MLVYNEVQLTGVYADFCFDLTSFLLAHPTPTPLNPLSMVGFGVFLVLAYPVLIPEL